MLHRLWRGFAAACVLLALCVLTSAAASAAAYKNFRAAIYVVVNSTQMLADKGAFDAQFDRVAHQLAFDKVYIEVYRDHRFASDAEIEKVKSYFAARGVAVAGGVTLAAGGKGGQFGTFDYEDPSDRAECKKAIELAARHFNEVILDDFFFYTSKSDADIAAKGARSWTQYRLDTMRKVAADLVVGPAHKVNPAVRVIIKYPNWYEHFHGLGFDLEKEPWIFDGIYTGTETREAALTDQLLQPYESFGIIRYYNAVRPGGNGGGWVDTGSLKNADRYVEQLEDTLFAKAPEITLFNWFDVAGPFPGRWLPPDAADPALAKFWVNPETYKAVKASYATTGKDDPGLNWARVAGFAYSRVDTVLGQLGNPVGIAAYKPFHSDGEDFLQHYLGTLGVPVEMTVKFPEGRRLVLLTESAAHDPAIVAKIKKHLTGGGRVVITSGFLKAMQDKGLRDIVEWTATGRVAGVTEFIDGFGAGAGTRLSDGPGTQDAITLPEVRFYTNDSWAIVRATAGPKGYPVLLSNSYSRGAIYLWTMPDNPADLYRLPQKAIAAIKAYLLPDMARLDAPAFVSFYPYDNGTVVAQSYRDQDCVAELTVPGRATGLTDLASGESIKPELQVRTASAQRHTMAAPEVTVFRIPLKGHSWRALRIGR